MSSLRQGGGCRGSACGPLWHSQIATHSPGRTACLSPAPAPCDAGDTLHNPSVVCWASVAPDDHLRQTVSSRRSGDSDDVSTSHAHATSANGYVSQLDQHIVSGHTFGSVGIRQIGISAFPCQIANSPAVGPAPMAAATAAMCCASVVSVALKVAIPVPAAMVATPAAAVPTWLATASAVAPKSMALLMASTQVSDGVKHRVRRSSTVVARSKNERIGAYAAGDHVGSQAPPVIVSLPTPPFKTSAGPVPVITNSRSPALPAGFARQTLCAAGAGALGQLAGFRPAD